MKNGQRKTYGNSGAGWDPSKDKLLWESEKILNDTKTEGYKLALRSYDGGHPKLEVTRAYKDESTGEWRVMRGEFRRMPWYLVAALVMSANKLESSYNDFMVSWKPKGKDSKATGSEW